MWKGGIKNPGSIVDDFVSFTDFAPTFLEVAGINPQKSGMMKMEGRSLIPLLADTQKGRFRDFMVIGKERTDLGRPDDQGYPIRGIVTSEFLFLRNYHPERWPAGNPETGYMDCDGSPTKTYILNDKRLKGRSRFWDWNFGKFPAEELYQITKDHECMTNLAKNPDYASVKAKLIREMTRKLQKDGDPRMKGQGDIFDTYPYSEDNRDFYNRFVSGEKLKAGWINPSDIEKAKIE
jgi:hypothetical protein